MVNVPISKCCKEIMGYAKLTNGVIDRSALRCLKCYCHNCSQPCGSSSESQEKKCECPITLAYSDCPNCGIPFEKSNPPPPKKKPSEIVMEFAKKKSYYELIRQDGGQPSGFQSMLSEISSDHATSLGLLIMGILNYLDEQSLNNQ